ncbi:MAG TPA: hypothetical protein VHC19_15600 [Pirellulales bacterium]|jgi:hypothetical protein|nr:hypothetical protein [Pirellulales bacterium]
MNRRDALSALALVALGGISLAAGAQAIWIECSSRRTFDRAELVAWLTERDLASVPRAVKLRLARQFEQDFAAGHDWKLELSQLDDARRERLVNNYAELSQAWFLDKVDRYFALQEPARTEYLDSQIDAISRWPVFDQGEFQRGPLLRSADLSRQLPRLQARFTTLRPDEQQRVQQFVGAVYLRWLARGFRQLIPLSPGES